MSDTPMEQAIIIMRNNVTTANEQVRSIESELEALQKCEIPINALEGHRLAQVIEANHTLMRRLRNMRDQLMNRNAENDELSRQLFTVILQKQKYQHTIAAFHENFQELSVDHSALQHLQWKNLSIVSSLWHCCSACGLDLLEKRSIQGRSLAVYLGPLLDDLIRILQEKKMKRLEEERRLKERRSEKRKAFLSPDFRGNRSDESGAGSQIRFEFPSTMRGPLVGEKDFRERFHVFIMLTTAWHCWAPQFGVRALIFKTWKELAVGMAETFRTRMDEVGAFQMCKIAMLRDVNMLLLRRSRISVEVSTNPRELSDAEAQTVDAKPTVSKKALITVPKMAKTHK
jgi:hypothetical protein